MSKRIRIYTELDVAEHNSLSSCWVSRDGKVYDVTGFLADHPGGDDLILCHAGKDIGAVMKDPEEHVHSDSAYDMLDEFLIGRLGHGEEIVTEDWVATEDFEPEETDTSTDYEKNEFLDLRQPLLYQSLLDFSDLVYLRCSPVHLAALPPFSVDIFAPYRLLSTVPIPAASLAKTGACFLAGNIIWTILEYTLHRFLFHLDYYLPDHPAAFTLHFLLHGIHHYLPMDRLRLVMPPLLFVALSYPFTQLAHFLFPPAVANGIIAGSYTFYVLYDCMHYALHHTRLPAYLREMKKYHLAHHYKNYDLAFGVTSKLWDYVFNTVLVL
ncbi:Ceramide very long chain fatty acid hydroxylase [Abortiporus biennis]